MYYSNNSLDEGTEETFPQYIPSKNVLFAVSFPDE
jgi:hypothetical protein